MPATSRAGSLPPCPEETLFVELARTTDLLSRAPARLLRTEGLSATQYNVLRILRGSPDGLYCGEIAVRMISRDPDITRLVDRLEKQGYVSRCRRNQDRRQIQVRISPAGKTLLSRLDEPVRKIHRRQLNHIPPDRQKQILELLLECRTGFCRF
jgi:DNA-binding MarR family transcriptional regulator